MRKHRKALLVAVLTAASCSSYFIAAYNPTVDRGATELQQRVDGFLQNLEDNAGTPAAEYDRNSQVYHELRSELQKLRGAASEQPGNGLTVQSLDLIQNNLDKFEAMHAGGISPKEIEIARALLDSQFRMLLQLENSKKREGGLS